MGCKSTPRLNGKDGQKGASITTPLTAGQESQKGMVTFAVHHNGGSTQECSSLWLLELAGFEVEDENGDCVFEPGESLSIRRIYVRNVGGMPSPTCPIPVMLTQSSEWFESLPA